ncbi:hypothetical protein [Qipengyuania sp.]|uniref:hypothetical protein n=1 Tax=Qipengyuania sp. TaxID=2004515 RepID=UPI0035116F96
MHASQHQPGFWFALLRQFYTATRQAVQTYKTDLRGAFYWIYARNLVSLRPGSNYAAQVPEKVKPLAETGYQPLPPLSPDLTRALVDHYLANVEPGISYGSLADYFESKRGEGLVRPAGLDVPLERELIGRIFAESGLVDLAEAFLGLDRDQMMFQAKIDTLVRISTDRTLVDGYDDALEIHRDVDSLKFVKAFYYLKDVEEGYGHHEVYLGTHRKIPWGLRLIRRYTEADLQANGVAAELKKVTGKAGSGFIENTTAFHRGTVPVSGDRIILSMSFNDLASTQAIYRGGHYAPMSAVLMSP